MKIFFGKPGRQELLHAGKMMLPFQKLIIAVTICYKRHKKLLLLFRPDDSRMRLIQVTEMCEQIRHILLSLRLFQHILPYKASEFIDFLHGNRLLEKIHGLFLTYPEFTAKIPRIRRIIIIGMNIIIAFQPLFEASHIRANIAEPFPDAQCLFCQYIEPCRISRALIPEPEYLCKSDSHTKVFIAKNAENHAVLIAVTQRLRLAAAILGPFLRKIAAYIRSKAAFLGTRISRLIIRYLFGRHQQCDDGIYQG